MDPWLEAPPPEVVVVDGVELRRGSRVRLVPRPGGDVLDLVLVGHVGIVERIEHDSDDRIHIAVTLEDDPARDLGQALQPGHLFFFGAGEIEPIDR